MSGVSEVRPAGITTDAAPNTTEPEWTFGTPGSRELAAAATMYGVIVGDNNITAVPWYYDRTLQRWVQAGPQITLLEDQAVAFQSVGGEKMTLQVTSGVIAAPARIGVGTYGNAR